MGSKGCIDNSALFSFFSMATQGTTALELLIFILRANSILNARKQNAGRAFPTRHIGTWRRWRPCTSRKWGSYDLKGLLLGSSGVDHSRYSMWRPITAWGDFLSVITMGSCQVKISHTLLLLPPHSTKKF